jgi:protein-S-isoprenylcysteine O-methyltransferase Ste14
MTMTDKDNDSSGTMVKTIVKVSAAIILLIGLFFGPAGTFNWPEAWIFLILYLVSVAALSIWLKKHDPELFKERMSVQDKKNVKKWDKYIMHAFTVIILSLFVVAALDAVRFQWSQVPLLIKVFGFLGLIPIFILFFLVMRENTYLSEMVRIQDDRGHHVCTTGPYKYVRHPMYLGIIIALACLPLALGSLYAFIPASLAIILFIIRTSLEDKTLQNELPGYKEYAQNVRYRLIIGVW